MNNSVALVIRDHLVRSEDNFQASNFCKSTGSFGNAGQFLLQGCSLPNGLKVHRFGLTLMLLPVHPRRQQGTSKEETVLVSDEDTTAFGFEETGKVGGAEFAATTPVWGANVRQVHHERVVHGQVQRRKQGGKESVMTKAEKQKKHDSTPNPNKGTS